MLLYDPSFSILEPCNFANCRLPYSQKDRKFPIFYWVIKTRPSFTNLLCGAVCRVMSISLGLWTTHPNKPGRGSAAHCRETCLRSPCSLNESAIRDKRDGILAGGVMKWLWIMEVTKGSPKIEYIFTFISTNIRPTELSES